jgi:His/Glu/Gln/Arg/opine family amino acid ABC transporter permease subunit
MTVFDIVAKYQDAFLTGLSITLKLCIIVWLIGILAGTMLGAAGVRWKFTIGIFSRFGSFFLSGIPVLVLLFWLHYPLQSILGVVIDPFYTSVATLSLINIFAVSDIVRNSMNDFPEEYIVSAKVCGLSSKQTFLYIQFPIILRQILPGLLIVQVNMLQATLFASLISVDEIFRISQRINAEIYKPVEIYTALALFFLAICLPLNGLAQWLKKRFTRDLSEK